MTEDATMTMEEFVDHALKVLKEIRREARAARKADLIDIGKHLDRVIEQVTDCIAEYPSAHESIR